jgi:hypothetical protein
MKRLTHVCGSRPATLCIAAAALLSASYASAQPAAQPPAAQPTPPAAAQPTPPAAAQPTPPAATPEPPKDAGAAQPTPPTSPAAPTTPAAEPTKAEAAPNTSEVAGEKAGEAEGEKAGEGEGGEGGEKKESHWYDNLELSAFADAYLSLNMNFPRPQEATNAYRGNDMNNGFSLAWAGIDASYEAGPVGATIGLRFGPQVPGYAGADAGTALENLRQAYVTWKPSEKFALDFGKWDTFAGAEGIDSQGNHNYTRGLVHWLAQPVFHTGFRATYTPSDVFSALAFIGNGWNNTIDNNIGKTFGLQLSLTPIEGLTAKVGYIGGPEQDDFLVQEADDGSTTTLNVGTANKRFRHLVDLVVTYDPSDSFSLLLNFDAGFEKTKPDLTVEATEDVKWFGLALSGRYAFSETFATALRGEFYKDPEGYTSGEFAYVAGSGVDTTLLSGTLTLEMSPTSQLSFKLDGRIDYANQPLFPKGAAESSKIQPTITLGAVAKTN